MFGLGPPVVQHHVNRVSISEPTHIIASATAILTPSVSFVWIYFTGIDFWLMDTFSVFFMSPGDVYSKQGSCDNDHWATGHWRGAGWWSIRCTGKHVFKPVEMVVFLFWSCTKLIQLGLFPPQCLSSYMEQFVGTESSLCSQAEGYFFKPVFLPR